MSQEAYYVAWAGAGLAGLLVGFLLGRRTGKARDRIRALEAQLESQRQELERASVQLQGANDRLKRAEEEHEVYRSQVVSHFSGASELFRDLTLHYRVLYDHLSEGARSLCPEGSLALEHGLDDLALPLDTVEGPDPAGPRPEASADDAKPPADDAKPPADEDAPDPTRDS